MKKKIISAALAWVMLVGSFPFFSVRSTAAEVESGHFPETSYEDSSKLYRDVPDGAWYRSAVDYVSTYGIMGGDGDVATFCPEGTSTRAMVVTILYRIEGKPKTDEVAPFGDITANWYRDAVNWAYKTGVVSGRSETVFDPQGNVTREELVKMIYGYVKYKGLDTTGVMDIDGYPDYNEVSKNWAEGPLLWAVCAGLIRGRADGSVQLLAPKAETKRCELATVFLRLCEKYDLVEEPYMTLEEVLADIKTARVKKVILDCDAGNEMDDQYAVAYALGSDRLDVIAANGSLFYNDRLVDSFEDGMKESTDEISRVLKYISRRDVPVYYGSPTPLSANVGLVPVKNAASENIIKAAHESDEMIYIVTTGAGTNIATAILMDPTIMDKICVIWMGGQYPGVPDKGVEYNLGQDMKAGQFLFNCGVNLVMLPGYCPDGDGTGGLTVSRADMFDAFPGTDNVSRFFRETLAAECDGTFVSDPDNWSHVMWDIAASAALDKPAEMTFGIITSPRIRNDGSYSHGENRHSVITLRSLDSDAVLERAWECINRFTNYTPEIEAMTAQNILDDLKSTRVKKVILDCDAGNEIDDQYAIAYALGSEKIEVLSINASQFLNTALCPTREAGMLEGYNEIKRVLKLVGREDVPVYKGCGGTLTKSGDSNVSLPSVTPLDSEAVDNIITTAKGSREIIYVVVTGAATNIASAIAKDESIKSKICVVWLGANHIDKGNAGEFNFGQDESAARYLFNCGVNFVWVPAMSPDSTKGSQSLKAGKSFLDTNFPGSDAASYYFREQLLKEHDGGYNAAGWTHTFWDAAGIAIFDTPSDVTMSITTLPRIRGDGSFDTSDKTRTRAVLVEKLNPSQTLSRMASSIASLITK